MWHNPSSLRNLRPYTMARTRITHLHNKCIVAYATVSSSRLSRTRVNRPPRSIFCASPSYRWISRFYARWPSCAQHFSRIAKPLDSSLSSKFTTVHAASLSNRVTIRSSRVTKQISLSYPRQPLKFLPPRPRRLLPTSAKGRFSTSGQG